MPRHLRSAAAGLLAAAAALATAGSATAAPVVPGAPRVAGGSASASIAGIPSSCWAVASYLQEDRTYSEMGLSGSRVTFAYPTKETGKLSYVPIAQVVRTTVETRTGIRHDGYSVSPGGTVQHVVRDWSDGNVMRTTRRTVQSGWTRARALSAGSGVVYAVIGDKLRRYDVSSTGSLVDGVTLSTAFGDVQTIALSAWSSYGDTLVASTSSGSLERVKTSFAKDTATRTVMRPSGFAGFKAVSTGNCGGTGEAMLGVSAAGKIYAYYDRDGFLKDAYQPSGRLASTQIADLPTYSN
ncbi:hypothetical protein [Janibacter sp. UYMM211]|uniref:hypothetical protein n=1 Tax=Janibacter sp. UYMM211 TaxID=3156342 RepID=UPI003395D8FC